MNIVEINVPLYEAAWLPWAVQYFFFIGLSTAAALVAALADLGGGERWRGIQPAAMLLALSTAVVAPVALLADLAQPGRFWHFYAYFTPWSWMSIGSILLPAYVGVLFVYGLLWQRERVRDSHAPGWLAWLGRGNWSGRKLLPVAAAATVVLALSILLYTGSEVMVVRARVLWHTLWLPVNLALTALVGALGGVLLLQHWCAGCAQAEAGRPFANRLLLAALLLTTLCALGWAASGMLLGGASFNEALRLFQQYGYWKLLFIASVVVGLVLVAGSMQALRSPVWLERSWLRGALALLAAWSFRWAVLMDVQTVPKYGAGLYPYQLPLGSDGLLGIAATFGLWAAMLMLLAMALGLDDPQDDEAIWERGAHG